MDVPGNTFIGPDGFKEIKRLADRGRPQPRRRSTPTWRAGSGSASEELTGVGFPL